MTNEIHTRGGAGRGGNYSVRPVRGVGVRMTGKYETLIKPVADRFDLAAKIEGATIRVEGDYAASLARALRAMARQLDREEERRRELQSSLLSFAWSLGFLGLVLGGIWWAR